MIQTAESVRVARRLGGIVPVRFAGHLTVLSIVLLIAAAGGWQHSVNSDVIIQAAASVPALESDERNYLAKQLIVVAPPRPLSVSAPPRPLAEPTPARSFFDYLIPDFVSSSLRDSQREIQVAPAAGVEPARREPITHEVQPGETASHISERYGISVDTIRWANGLDDVNLLSVGQRLVILPVSGVLHAVRSGDTLAAIAARYDVEQSAIVSVNQLADPNVLTVDARLIVPGGRMPDPPRPQPVARGGLRPTEESPPPAPAAAAPPSRVGGDLVGIAMGYLGSPYVFGGASPRGFDCSGFVQYVFRQKGIAISRDLWGMLQIGSGVDRSNLQPGDLVFFANTYQPGLSHVGIYVGGGKMVNAESERSGVTVSNINNSYWASRYYAARRP